MLAFLLGFLGVGAAAAAGGGGSDSSPARGPQTVAPPVSSSGPPEPDARPPEPDARPPVVADDDDMDHDHDDDTDDGMDDDHGDDGMGDGTDHDHGDDGTDDGMGDGTDHDHGDDGMGGGMGGGTDDDHGDDGMGGGTDHDHDPTHVVLPTTPAEVEAFVAAVRASPEMHIHDDSSPKMGEHLAALDLVPRDEATHIAIANGDWDNPANWHNGEVPGDNARVLIPEGVHMTYDHVSDTRLFTVRVDGELEFATDADSQMVVDTLVVSPSGHLEIGTADNPVQAHVNVDIIFANNGAIDTNWDPLLLSRGMIAHGSVEIHGTEKDSHEKVADSPQAGDTWVTMDETPAGWAVGDTIVIAGTRYEGYYRWEPEDGYSPSEDEVRVITDIKDGMIFFDEPLRFDHDAPRDDLMTSVANYTRNVSFETENAADAEIYERGHVMFMHNDDVDVRYAEFHELGRTDKSETALNASEFDSIEFDSNVKGRYSFHFHRAGVDDLENPATAIGNAVYGSPGWGFVHHDSNAVLENNATFDTFGAGYVAESGNETGSWTDNIAIFAQGQSWQDAKVGNDLENFDLGQTGDGFWFQGRMVESIDNIAASVNHGFVYFHRGGVGEDKMIQFDGENSPVPGAFWYDSTIFPDQHPILSFSGNEVFASNTGLYVLKASPIQEHDVHSVLEDFTAWSVKDGADISYTGHYILKDFDLIAKEDTSLSSAETGIKVDFNSTNLTFINPTIEGFDTGIDLVKGFAPHIGGTIEDHDFTIIDPTFIDVDHAYKNYDPAFDTILSSSDLPYLTPDLQLDGPLTYKEGDPANGARQIEITGTKTDSLGEISFPDGVESFIIYPQEMPELLNEKGYYTTNEGQNYFNLDIYFSDRITGDIYVETHPVFIDANVPLGVEWAGWYADVPFNGVRDLDSAENPQYDVAELWATITDGQPVLTDHAQEMMPEDEPEQTTFDM